MTDTTIALVTGANKGIGLAAARRLAEQGWTVLLGSRDSDRGAAAVAELGDLDVRAVPLDVTSQTSVSAAAKLVDAGYGRLDVLVITPASSARGCRPWRSARTRCVRSTRPTCSAQCG